MKTIYRSVRSVARRAGLGRLRDSARDRVYESAAWISVPPRRLKDIDAGGVLPQEAMALTFDDGPDPHVTPELLRLLESHSARATFFMCGVAAKRHPELVREVVDAGHCIGAHTWDHQVEMLAGMPESSWRRQIDDTHALLADLTGAAVPWFRPPRGIIDRPTLRRLRDYGLQTVLWSIDGLDCTLREPTAIAERVTNELGPGQIVLLHDANANFLFAEAYPPVGEVGNQRSTLSATRTILEAIGERGLNPVSFQDLAGRVMPSRGRPRIMSKK